MWVFARSLLCHSVLRAIFFFLLYSLTSCRVYAHDEPIYFRPKPLTQRATNLDLAFQPAIDFGNDGCYNVAAVDAQGQLNAGRDAGGQHAACQDFNQEDSNVYVRSRCNHGYCAWLYAYYFEKQPGDLSSPQVRGRKHSWEHVVIWVNMKTQMTEWVAVSVYGVYQDVRSARDVLYAPGGLRPLLVYDKQPGGTYAFQFARADERIKNRYNRYWTSPLITYEGFPSHFVRESLMKATWRDIDGTESLLGLNSDNFADELRKARPTEIQNFDVHYDDPRYHAYVGAFPEDPVQVGFMPVPALTMVAAGRTVNTVSIQSPLKVMVVGDSISHGSDGDFTWRYRIKQWFERDAKIPTNFVGPYNGTHCRAPTLPPQPPPLDGESKPSGPCTKGSYWRKMQFDSNHYALWGQQANIVKKSIREQVATYQPDLLLVMLGWNDIGWKITDARGLLESMQTIVDEARHGNPTLKIALANVVHRYYIAGSDYLVANTTEYNELLKAAIPRWSTTKSPITHVDVNSQYSCSPIENQSCLAAWDGLHPDILGEWEIAQAFSTSLNADFKYGQGPLAIPHELDERDVHVPDNIVAQESPMGVKFTWAAREGARIYEIRHRMRGQGDEQWVVDLTETTRFDITTSIPGVQWELMVRVNAGIHRKGPWSDIYRTNSGRGTAPPPKEMRVIPKDGGFDITWQPPDGDWKVERYHILSVDQDTPGTTLVGPGVAAGERSRSIRGLISGHTYRIYMATWSHVHGENVGGLIGEASPIRVGGSSSPDSPADLTAINLDATTVKLTWSQTGSAPTNYKVFTESLNESSKTLKWDGVVVHNTSYEVRQLLPGTWHYRLCVKAFNGDYESGLSTCVVPDHF